MEVWRADYRQLLHRIHSNSSAKGERLMTLIKPPVRRPVMNGDDGEPDLEINFELSAIGDEGSDPDRLASPPNARRWLRYGARRAGTVALQTEAGLDPDAHGAPHSVTPHGPQPARIGRSVLGVRHNQRQFGFGA